MKKRIIYLFYKQFAKGSKMMYLWLIFISIIPILILSLIIFISALLNPELNPFIGHNNDFWQVFFSQLLAALDPGTFLELINFNMAAEGDSIWQGNSLFFICSLLATLSGLMIVATLIGMVSSSMENVMLNLRKGKSIVVEKDHIIILGWNDQIFSVINELQLANQNMKQQTCVVMANQDTAMMQDEINNRIHPRNLDMVYRSGRILFLDDLKKLSIKNSRSIIILADMKDRDSQAIKVSLAINRLTPGDFEFKPNFSIVVAMEKEENIKLLKNISKNTITVFNTHFLQSRIIAQCCRQAGLSIVYNDLLDFAGDEIYFFEVDSKKWPEHNFFIDKKFQDVLLILNDSTLIGIVTNNICIIQPKNNYIIKNGDMLILIQSDDNSPEITNDLAFYKDSLDVSEKQAKSDMNILVINWNEDSLLMLEDLDKELTAESNIDIVLNDIKLSELDDSGIKQELSVIRDFIVENDLTQDFFREIDLVQYDSIVLLSDNLISDIDISNISDAKSIITLLKIRIVLKELDATYIPIVSQIQHQKNKYLMESEDSYDIIVSNKLIGNYTCQLAQNPKLQHVFNQILHPEGSEFYMRKIEDYIKIDNNINFFTLVKAGIKKNNIVVGYKIKIEEHEKNHGIYLNPKKSDEITFSKGDRVIVLAEN